MVRPVQFVRRGITRAPRLWLLVPALALLLTGCSGMLSDDPNKWYNKTLGENISGHPDAVSPNAPGYAAVAPAQTNVTPGVAPVGAPVPPAPSAPAPATFPAQPAAPSPGLPSSLAAGPQLSRAATDADLYRSEASCGGINLGSGAPPTLAASQSVALDMTECEVVHRLGAPDRMELGATDRGQRLLTLTYGRGQHPRLYRFASGRLYSIEALPSSASGQHTKPTNQSGPPARI